MQEKQAERGGNNPAVRSRYWLASAPEIGDRHIRRLLPSERWGIAAVILEALERDPEDPAALILGLSYATGREVEVVIAALAGKDGGFRFTDNGAFEVEVPWQPNAPTGGSLAVTLPLPTALVRGLCRPDIWQRIKKDAGTGHRPLLLAIVTLLDQIRARAGPRITRRHLTRALAVELMTGPGDALAAWALVGSGRWQPPNAIHYIQFSVAWVSAAYRKALAGLFGDACPLSDPESQSLDWPLGADVPPPATCARLVEALRDDPVRSLRPGPDTLATIHNWFTRYTVTLLHFATGYRLVNGAFCIPGCIDLAQRLVIISDKHTDDVRDHRLVALPALAVLQLGQYQRYLAGLAAHLHRIATRSARGLGERRGALALAVDALAAGRSSPLPRFFFLHPRLTGFRWFRAGELRVAPDQQHRNLPRRWFATTLHEQGIPFSWIAALLGHTRETWHPLGVRQDRPPIDILRQCADVIDRALATLGFRPLLPYEARRTVQVRKAPPLVAPESPAMRRARWRKEREARIRIKVDEIIKAAFDDSQPADRPRLRKEAAEAVRAWADAVGLPGRLCRDQFHARLAEYERKHGWTRTPLENGLPREPSPFTPGVFRAYGQIEALRTAFHGYLSARYRQGPVTYTDRLAEIALSAMLHGGLVLVDLVRSMIRVLPDGLRRIGDDILYVDIPCYDRHYRWYPDPITAALIVGLVKICHHQGELPFLEQALSELVGRLDDGHRLPRSLDRLAQRVRAWYVIACPGPVQVLIAHVPVASLSEPQFVALLDGGCVGKTQTRPLPSVKPLSELALVEPFPDTEAAVIEAINLFHTYRKELFTAPPVAAVRTPEKARAALRSQLARHYRDARGDGQRGSLYPPFLMSVLEWAQHMCTHGGARHRDLRIKTIDKYVTQLVDAVAPEIGAANLLDLERREWTEAYDHALERTGTDRAQTGLFGLIREYHLFLEQQLPVDTPDWRALGKHYKGRTARSRRAPQVLAEANYQMALKWIMAMDASPLVRLQTGALLMLGYRFGLRYREAAGLMAGALIEDPKAGWCALVTRSQDGPTKTPAGRRIVAACGTLSETERRILSRLPLMVRNLPGANARTNLFRPVAAPDGRYVDRMARTLKEILVQVTGEPGFSYHDLRHSFNVRRMLAHGRSAAPLPPNDPFERHYRRLCQALGLTEAATAPDSTTTLLQDMGHREMDTTCLYYMHMSGEYLRRNITAAQAFPGHRAMAYCVQSDEAALRQRAHRGRTYPEALPSSIPTPAGVTVPIPEPSSASPRPSLPLYVWQHLPVLLETAGTDPSKARRLATDLEIDPAVTELILQTATEVETEARYTPYGLGTPARQGRSLRARALRQNEAERARLNHYLGIAYRLMRQFSDRQWQAVTDAMALWVAGRRGDRGEVSFRSLEALYEFREGLNHVKLSDIHWGVQTPGEAEVPQDHMEFLVIHPFQNPGAAQGRPGRRRVIARPLEIPLLETAKGLNRALFLIAVWTRVRSNLVVAGNKDEIDGPVPAFMSRNPIRTTERICTS